jgi:hypothetical protein
LEAYGPAPDRQKCQLSGMIDILVPFNYEPSWQREAAGFSTRARREAGAQVQPGWGPAGECTVDGAVADQPLVLAVVLPRSV